MTPLKQFFYYQEVNVLFEKCTMYARARKSEGAVSYILPWNFKHLCFTV